MPFIVDTDVLIDLFGPSGPWEEWSARSIERCRAQGHAVVNALIYAEMAAGFANEAALYEALPPSRFVREPIPFEAAYAAGQAFLAYRRAGGEKRSPLPDFYIGAHAQVRGHTLLTRDPSRYRSSFPGLDIVAPDTHP